MDAADSDADPGADAPEVFDFLEEAFQDLEEGGLRPLEHYLRRFPGHEVAVRREYAALAGGPRPTEDPRAASADADGRVGPYRLLAEIGRGGQGVVHLAEDTRIARRVALKVLPRAALLLSEDSRRRLRREAEVISRLDHPGLCGIYDAVIEDDLAYIAMPFVEGRTLAAVIADAREERGGDSALPVAPAREPDLLRLLRFFEEAARALHSAHEAGVIHRDVKPANLMVTGEGRPVWLDFGQARSAEGDAAALTLSGEVFGTPAYMSPEQVAGEPLDRRTDVWSLGVTLFEALSQQRPFEASTAHGLLAAIRDGEPRRIRELSPSVGVELSVVLATAMERDLTRRYKSALDLADDLARLRRREPIRARPASRALRMRRWIQRYPVLFALLLVVSASLVAVSWLLREQLRAVEDKDVALAEAERKLEAALGRHKAQRAGALLGEDPGSALILAIEGVELAPNALTREALFAALEACWLRAVYEAGEGRRFLDLAVVPGASRVVAVASDGVAALHDLESGARLVEWRAHEPAAEGEPAGLCAAASGDGRLVATGGADGRVVVRDLLGAEPERVLVGPGGAVLALAFGLAGDRLALRTAQALVVRDLRSGEEVARHAGLAAPLAPLEFDPRLGAFLERPRLGTALRAWRAADGVALEGEAAPGAGVLWQDLRAGGRLELLSDGSARRAAGGASAPALAPGEELRLARGGPLGRRLFLAAEGRRGLMQRVVDLGTGRVVPLPGGSTRAPVEAAFSPDGDRLAVIDGDRVLRLWDARDGMLLGEGRGYLDPHALEWSAEGDRVLTHQMIGPQARLWYGRARPDTFTLRAGSAPVRLAAFAPGGERALTLDEAGELVVWRTEPGDPSLAEAELRLTPARGRFTTAAFDPAGELLLAAGEEVLEVWDLGLRERLVLRTGGAGLAEASWTTDGAIVLTSGPLRLDPRTGREERAVSAPVRGRVVPLPSGEGWLELSETAPTVALRSFTSGGPRWEAALGDEAGRPLGASAELVVDIAFAPGGREAALARSDRWIDFLDLATGAAVRRPVGVFPPAGIDWSGEGRRLLVWGRAGRGAFRVLDLEPDDPAGGAMRAEQYHADDLTTASFGDGGRLALSASRDGTLLVRQVAELEDPRATRLLARLVGPGAAVTAAALGPGPGGPRVIAGFADGTARVWPVDPMPAALARRPRPALAEWELARERRQAAAARLEYR